MPYRKTLRALLLGFVGASQCLFLVTTTWGQTQASVPHLVKYSGVLRDGAGNPMVGTVGVSFALYKEEQGGSPLWVESQNVQLDALGRYSVSLGSTQSSGLPQDLFVSGEARWLGVRAEGQAEQSRSLLLSVPYALKAGDAETVGGLPASAFMLAGSGSGSSLNSPSGSGDSQPNVGGSGTQNFIPLWTDNNGTLGNSVMFQSGTGSSAKTGVNTTSPAATLDVNGGEIVRGAMQLPATGTATAAKGFTSQPLQLQGSSFNSTTQQAIGPVFQLQTEPASNNTASPSGTLNLLYSNGSGSPTETGLNIASNGQIKFASGQTFPGAGTITGITAGTGLSGGGTSGNVTLSINIPFANQNFANLNNANTFTKSQTVNGNLTASGTLNAGIVNATTAFQLGNQIFGSGSSTNSNAFLGFAGNLTTTGFGNTGVGFQALFSDTTGYTNTATGTQALLSNTTGINNTAIGWEAMSGNTTGQSNTAIGTSALESNTSGYLNTASGNLALFFNNTGQENTADGAAVLYANTTGNNNTAEGYGALSNNTTGNGNTAQGYSALDLLTTGSNNTAVGYFAGDNPSLGFSTGSNDTFIGANAGFTTANNVNNATAIGANATVTADNSLVLGSINGINGATADTNVGIGTTAPAAKLDVHGTGNFTGIVTFASGQTFPGTGTVTSVGSGAGLTGGPITGSGSLSIATAAVTNAMLANPSLTVAAGTGLSGGGSIPLGGSTTLNVDTTKVPLLNAANNFTANQSVNGNLNITGAYQLGGTAFAFGSTGSQNVYLGFAGNNNLLSVDNTAIGYQALTQNSQNCCNTVTGWGSLIADTSGIGNTASGWATLNNNTTGSNNTAMGYASLEANNVGSNNSAFGYASGPGSANFGLNNTTAIGANAEVDANNAMVLGSIKGMNNATANTNVGVAITTPVYRFHVGSSGDIPINGYFRVEGPGQSGGSATLASFGGLGDFSIDAPFLPGARLILKEGGNLGLADTTPTNIFTIGRNKGHALADGWDTYSSRRWKRNIQTLPDALSKVERLRGVSYDLNDSGKHEIGVIAEEVGAVVPEVVTFEDNGKDARGVDYSRLTALLIEATKAQQQQIRKQLAFLHAQAAAIRSLKSELRETQRTLLAIQAQVQSSQNPLLARK